MADYTTKRPCILHVCTPCVCAYVQAGDYVSSADLGSAYHQTSAGSDMPASGETP